MPDMKLVKKYNKLKHKQRKIKHNGKMITLYKPVESDRKDKKLQVYIEKDGRIQNIHFGNTNYEDFTIHKDKDRKENYCARSKGMCKKYGCDESSANFWSRMVLWNC